jgi:hypothetical protein
MRYLLPGVLLLLAGCDGFAANAGYLLSADMATIMMTGRGGPDIVVSALSGRDCNVVNLDNRLPYCKPLEQPPPPQPVCVPTLGIAECFAQTPPGQRGLGDHDNLTQAQADNLKAGWLERQIGIDFQ